MTQYRGVEGSEIKQKIDMDMDLIKKPFLRELDLVRDLKENIRLKCLVVHVQRTAKRAFLGGVGEAAGASALGQD